MKALPFLVLVVCVLLHGCVQPEAVEPKQITGQQARVEYVDHKLEKLKSSKFLGGADSGVSGGAELYKILQAEAQETFPGDQYFKSYNSYTKEEAVRYGVNYYIDIEKYRPVMKLGSYSYFVLIEP